MELTSKFGVTDELAEMAYDRLTKHRSYQNITVSLGVDGVKRALETNQWAYGIYEGDRCVAGLWGDEMINLVTRQGYETKWITPIIFRKFWKFFFGKYDKAVAVPDNGRVIPFMLRMGFEWEDNKLVCHKDQLKLAG
jgi:hypothetical protein